MNDAGKARDEAIDRVEQNADEMWAQYAWAALLECCKLGRGFTSDDVKARIPREVTTHEPRAMGAIMQRGRRLGFIQPTDQQIASTNPKCHARPQRVWIAATNGAAG